MKTLNISRDVRRVSGIRFHIQAFTAMVYRQLVRFTRARSRLINAFTMPIIWLVFFGLGWASAFNRLGPVARMLFKGLSYIEYLIPGLVLMSAFTGGLISGLAIIFDREFGYLKELLVTPASRPISLLGRLVGDSIVATIQSTIMLIILMVVTEYTNILGFIAMIGIMLVTSLLASTIGASLALSMASPEGFQAIVNLITMPMIFLSGAFYPLDTLKPPLSILATINPLTHPVQLARWAMYGVIEEPLSLAIVGTIVYTLIFTILATVKYRRTYVA